MKHCMRLIILFLCVTVSMPATAEQAISTGQSDSSSQASTPIRVNRMRCENRDQPLGIDHPAPRLSWTLESAGRGQKQTAYRVLVARNLET